MGFRFIDDACVITFINPRDARYADARDVIVDASRRVAWTRRVDIFFIDRASSSSGVSRVVRVVVRVLDL